ncbi:B3 domain-containing protein At4g01580 [Linum grandiflorum]
MAVPSSFYRSIRQSNIRDKKLILPPQYNVDELSRSATLYVYGREWEVELIRNNEEICFCNKGWQRFAEFYSLDPGHVLFFKYNGLSTFSVFIFHSTGDQIKNPVSNGDEISDADADELNISYPQ